MIANTKAERARGVALTWLLDLDPRDRELLARIRKRAEFWMGVHHRRVGLDPELESKPGDGIAYDALRRLRDAADDILKVIENRGRATG